MAANIEEYYMWLKTPQFYKQSPALLGFFNVHKKDIEKLKYFKEKIEKEIEDEQARTKLFLAELFLAGPEAWPDNKSC